MAYIRKVHSVTFHRNGISGASFYAVTFTTREYPVRYLTAVVFDAPCHVAVINPSDMPARFRGDLFEPELRAAIGRATELDLVGHAGKVGQPLPAA